MAITKAMLQEARAISFAEGQSIGRRQVELEVQNDLRQARNSQITAMLAQAAALAQANAKLTYSLSLLVEKAKV